MTKKPSKIRKFKDQGALAFAGIFQFPLSIFHFFTFCLFFFPPVAFAQKIALLTPEKNERAVEFASKLENSFSGKLLLLDRNLSETAFNAVVYENPFNLSLEESKNIGAAIGCNYFLLIQARTLRRFSLEKKDYYESFAAVFAVSSRTGRLIYWNLISRPAANPAGAEESLSNSADDLAAEIIKAVTEADKKEANEDRPAKLEELPEETAPEAKNFRPPLPFKRIRPRYTEIADLYGIEATVDILLDVDETGRIIKTEISRWAGFGLDESVTETVREMNWRPASRNGKTLPMRVLLRYNFKKIENNKETEQ
ncbi:MAG: energy transducer TonB [Pyrinomonadaceae bacterium]